MQASQNKQVADRSPADVAKLFKSLSDPTRLRILALLVQTEAEICVCEFVDSLQERQYNVSKHVRVLENAGAVVCEKEGRFTYYRLAESVSARDSVALWEYIVTQLRDNRVCQEDSKRFKARLTLREDGRCRVGVQTASLSA